MSDLSDVAVALLVLSAGFALGALAHWIVDVLEARKWRRAERRVPYITRQ